MLEKVGEEDKQKVLAQLANIDWSKWDAIEKA
jgi:hypothetical protein